jgi:hypothetical protein
VEGLRETTKNHSRREVIWWTRSESGTSWIWRNDIQSTRVPSYTSQPHLAVPWLRRLVAGLPLQGHKFNPRVVYMTSVADGSDVEYLRFTLSFTTPSLRPTQLSAGASTNSPIKAAVPRDAISPHSYHCKSSTICISCWTWPIVWAIASSTYATFRRLHQFRSSSVRGERSYSVELASING